MPKIPSAVRSRTVLGLDLNLVGWANRGRTFKTRAVQKPWNFFWRKIIKYYHLLGLVIVLSWIVWVQATYPNRTIQ